MTEVDTDALFTVYLLLRSFYVLKFIVHSESYYGSRPDRLSRLYAVRFGTFNAVKYLINEKPFFSLLVIYLMLFLELPLALYIIEGYSGAYLEILIRNSVATAVASTSQ